MHLPSDKVCTSACLQSHGSTGSTPPSGIASHKVSHVTARRGYPIVLGLGIMLEIRDKKQV
jgi:hypothetical protein